MNIQYTKSIFDICLKDDTKTSQYQIQIPYDNSDDNDLILSIVTQLFKAELTDRYVVEYVFAGGSKNPEFIYFLDHHYVRSTRKKEFLTIIEDLVLPQAIDFLKTFQLMGDKKQHGVFDSFVNEWLIEQKTFLSINQSAPHAPIETAPAADDGRSDLINVFNNMPLKMVSEYFTRELSTLSKNQKPYLNVDEIDQFIRRAFCGDQSINKLYLNYAGGEKGKVIEIFYRYYEKCTSGYLFENTMRSQAKYKRLIDDNFTNMGTYNFRSK